MRRGDAAAGHRERIIIRTSLAANAAAGLADARALTSDALNLIGNSIHLAKAGGRSSFPPRCRISTRWCCGSEIPARGSTRKKSPRRGAVPAQPPSDQRPPLRRQPFPDQSLVEANRAHFHIKTAFASGTSVE